MKSNPDFIIMDFFTDIHMGITRKLGRYVTRNHMAFSSAQAAEVYFNDEHSDIPERMRFESDEYLNIAINSLKALRNQLASNLPKTRLIVNSARFSTEYTDGSSAHSFPLQGRIQHKNTQWNRLDEIAVDTLGAERIVHDNSLFIASQSHPWGLHPVHYTQPYYDHLWQRVREITEG